MAFFKFRKGTDDTPAAPVPPQSVEAIRQRAKYRLVGASVLVLLGVVGFPLLFDKQPRPIAVDTPINIPDKNKVLPLVIPVEAASAGATPAAVSAASALSAAIITETAEAPKPDAKSAEILDKKQPVAQAEPAQTAIQTIAKDAPVDAPKAVVKASAPAEASRAQALLDGKAQDAKAAAIKPIDSKVTAAPDAAVNGRFVVQVGAFADNARAHAVRLKVEQTGLKTYAQVAETKDGRRIRVRVGPFGTKAEAEKAAEKIKKLNLPTAVLTL